MVARIPSWQHHLGGLVERHPGLLRRLANMETRMAADRLADVAIHRPIWIAGLARSGSTILLEMLARHPEVATHRYRDFPLIHLPLWWTAFVDRAATAPAVAEERAHKDRIMVTAESPEAMEEVLWMAFFPDAHRPGVPHVLGRADRRPDFARFYREHLQKLLLARGRRRYLAKGNYNVTRLAWLHETFPDARFVIPVREPVAHIASLAKQHLLFREAGRGDPRVLDHLRRVGHFEFGPDRRPVDVGDGSAAAARRCWEEGNEVGGWARCWAGVYGFIAAQLEADPALRAACRIVVYEDLCRAPADELAALYQHCGLIAEPAVLAAQAAELAAPDYYRADFDPAVRAEIAAVCEPVLTRILGLKNFTVRPRPSVADRVPITVRPPADQGRTVEANSGNSMPGASVSARDRAVLGTGTADGGDPKRGR